MKTNLLFLIILTALCGAASAQDPVNIGDRRELFLDNILVDRLEGGAQRVFHKPVPREVVITFDKPWEGNTCLAVAVFQVGDVYRLYYRASNTPGSAGGEKRGAHTFDAYAESADGRHWTRPALGLVEFQGSKDNNLIPKPAAPKGWALDAITPFRDENPEAAADAQIIGGGADGCNRAVHVVEMQGHSGTRFVNSQIYGDIIVEATNHAPLTFSACGLFGSMHAANGIGLARIEGGGKVSFTDCHIHCIDPRNTPEQADCKCAVASFSTATPLVITSCSKPESPTPTSATTPHAQPSPSSIMRRARPWCGTISARCEADHETRSAPIDLLRHRCSNVPRYGGAGPESNLDPGGPAAHPERPFWCEPV